MAKTKPGFAAPKKLRCTCDADGRLERVPADQLQPYQRDLKELTEQRYAQLEASMERYGFTSPLLAWTDPKGVVWVLDGHQRLRVLERQGWTVEGGIPVVSVEAADAKEAAEKLLVIVRQYGQIDIDGLYEFGVHYEVDLASFDLAALPEVDWEAFTAGWLEDGGQAEPAERKTRNLLNDALRRIKPVLFVSDVAVFERAIRLTGMRNRGEAIVEICRKYVEEG